jgi:putative ABC transport system substrate-binding protein
MNRRDTIIALLALGALPPAGAQQEKKVVRVGILGDSMSGSWDIFRQALADLGWIEGRNTHFESRWAEGRNDRLPALADELARLKVDVIVSEGGISTLAAKKATGTIPIVMVIAADPVGIGLVASLSRPGSNVTGSASPSPQLASKQMQLLREVVPNLTRLSVIWIPANPAHLIALKELETAAVPFAIAIHRAGAPNASDLERAFSAITKQRSNALLILGTPIFDSRQTEIARFSIENRIPAMFNKPFFAEAGGLMTYGVRYADFFQQAAAYVDKILKGARPADLPVQQPDRFELVINLKTAKSLGIKVPQSILLRATRVIE